MTPAQSAAVKKYRENQAKRGVVPVTICLSSKARDRLKQLAKAYGSQQAAIEVLLDGDNRGR